MAQWRCRLSLYICETVMNPVCGHLIAVKHHTSKIPKVIRALAVVFIIICPSSSPLCAVGPFEVYSPDSATVLRLQLAGQLQAVWESKDKGKCSGRVSPYQRDEGRERRERKRRG